ncbi:signal peptidase II [Reinekea thalattae]|uniref:Lipoprotein signal peptidase n=1 Tax=Reinekea thalattae TaxID=2593301 RepID=A0A5C8ZC37_9GAMM|nr:signal peptidase II [Reinekea thalattae]
MLFIAPILILGSILDRITKLWAVNFLQGEPSVSYFSNFIRITYAENTGAFLGLGYNLPPQVRFWLLTATVGLFLLGLIVYLFIGKEVDKTSIVSLSLIFTGGFNNFIDRAFNDGAVVDFLNMGIGSLRTGIFNVADMYIMAGAALLIVGQFLFERKSRTQEAG